MQLDENEIALWIAHLDDTRDAHLLDEYRSLLTADERAREMRYRFDDDRHRHLLARALSRTALARYTRCAPSQLRFVQNAHGKPELASDNPEGYQFNLSHSKGLVVLTVARGRSLGVDTESLHSRSMPLEVAEQNFSAIEIADLHAVPEARRSRRILEYWTLKEAYVKARGVGISMPLDRFGFRIGDDDRVALWMHTDLNDTPQRWRLWQFLGASEYLIGLCAERRDDEAAPRLSLTQTVPLHRDRAAELTLLRASA